MIARSPGSRLLMSIALAGVLVVSSAGCTFIAPQATLIRYNPADGIGVDLGAVLVRDAKAVLGEDGSELSIAFVAVNTTDRAQPLTVSFPDRSIQSQSFLLPGGIAPISFGGPDDDLSIVIGTPRGVVAGGLLPIVLQAGDGSSVPVEIPVLDVDSRPYLEDLQP